MNAVQAVDAGVGQHPDSTADTDDPPRVAGRRRLP
jgi:hypothetical protein